jgi:hypothetical protein
VHYVEYSAAAGDVGRISTVPAWLTYEIRSGLLAGRLRADPRARRYQAFDGTHGNGLAQCGTDGYRRVEGGVVAVGVSVNARREHALGCGGQGRVGDGPIVRDPAAEL